MASCLHPSAQNLLLALFALFILGLIVSRHISPRYYKVGLIINALLILLTLWAGDYRYSPLGFASEGRFVLQEFVVLTRERGEKHIAPNEIITLGRTSAAFIQPILKAENTTCNWHSLNGGQLDGQDSCSLVYIPPPADYDILRLSIQPGCGLPNTVEQIRISILP
jgi:hypothetical protein